MSETTTTINPHHTGDLRAFLKVHDDVVYESVAVPEWMNRTVWVRSISSAEKDAFEASITKRVTEKVGRKRRERSRIDQLKFRAKLVIKCACVGDGNPAPLFQENDLEWLAEKNGAAIERVFDVASRLAGFSDDDVAELGKE